MAFWHSWRCSLAFLTSVSFNRTRVPIVRWNFAGFWKMLSSTPWSCASDDIIWKKKSESYTDISVCELPLADITTVGFGVGQNTKSVVFLVSFHNSTCEHCCSTCSLNLRNPSWILGWLKGNDRKCVNGCFLRKLSTRTSTRVTADDTADLLGAVITVSNRGRPRGWTGFLSWWWQ